MPERRSLRVYLREAAIWGLFLGGLYAGGWWFTNGAIFELGVVGLIAAFGLGAAIGVLMEWQLDDDHDEDD